MMRSLVLLGLAASFGLIVSGAHAQGTFSGPARSGFGNVKPAALPKSGELPKAYEDPTPYKPHKIYQPPAPKPFEPIKPFKGVEPNATQSGYYPELYPKKKH